MQATRYTADPNGFMDLGTVACMHSVRNLITWMTLCMGLIPKINNIDFTTVASPHIM